MQPSDTINDPSAGTPFRVRDACDIAEGLINSLLALQTGNGRVEIRIGDRSTAFNKVNSTSIAALTTNIQRWCGICQEIDPDGYIRRGLDAYVRHNQRHFAVNI